METFFEYVREVLKGIVREASAFLFRKNLLENKKTTLRRPGYGSTLLSKC